MKRHSCIFFLTLLIVFQACTSVTFEEPQPSDEPDIKSIPPELTGKYMSLQDSGIFTVTDKLATRQSIVVINDAVSKDSMLQYVLTNDTFLIFHDSTRVKAHILNDTVYARFIYTDTVFNLSAKNILRKYKNSYFMNVLEDEGWEVTKLHLHKGKLYVSSISSKEDVRKLRKITETTDTTKTVFKPTPVQFKKFVRKKGFGTEEVLVKVE